jgi:hypothetical protein
MPTKKRARAKSQTRRFAPPRAAVKRNRVMFKRASSPRNNKVNEQHELRAELLDMFLQRRDHPSCPATAYLAFNAMADSVSKIPSEGLNLYLKLKRDHADELSAAAREVLAGVRDGSYKPTSAVPFVSSVLVLCIKISSVWWMDRIENGDKDELDEFFKRSEPESSRHARSSADFTTTTSGFRFPVHVGDQTLASNARTDRHRNAVRSLLEKERLLGVRKLRCLHRSRLLPAHGSLAENSSQNDPVLRSQIMRRGRTLAGERAASP